MNIRKYQSKDREACIQIFNSNCPKYFDPTELVGFNRWLDGQDKQLLTNPSTVSNHYYVYEYDNNIIACGGFHIFPEEAKATMAWGMVNNDQHKKGIGTALFNFRVKEIQNLHPEHKIILDTTQHTFKFFERFGFNTVKITENGYGFGLDRYDMVL